MTRLRDEVRKGSGSTTYFTAAAPLALDAGPEVWPLLVEARDAGIAILPGEGVVGPVEVRDEPARLVLHVLRAEDDSGDLLLRLTTEGLPEAVGELLHLGDPVHGLAVEGADGSLTLLPLEQDLALGREAISQAVLGLRVPADERARFLRTAVPGLRDHIRVRSEVPLPVPADPSGQPGTERVTVHARVLADVPGEVRLDLGFAYDGRVRSFSTARFGGAVRDRAAEGAALEAATSVHELPRATWRDSTGHLHLTARLELKGTRAARFVTDQLPALEADEHVTLEVDADLPAYEEVTSAPVIRLGTDDPGAGSPAAGGSADPTDWFDLHISIEVAGEEVPFEPLFAALAADEEVMLLDSGLWFRLDRPELVRLKELIDEARDIADPESGGLRLSAHHVDFWEELVAPRRRRPAERPLGGQRRGASLPRWPCRRPPARRAASGAAPLPARGLPLALPVWDAGIGGSSPTTWASARPLQVIAALARAHERAGSASCG